MINLTMKKTNLEKNIRRAVDKNILIPTYEQMKNPEIIPDFINDELKKISLWEQNSLNLFRVTWKNSSRDFGGGFGKVNFLELPSALTGVEARIIGLVGKWFPTGSHKVGATFGCLVPSLVTGQFNSENHKAVWPSTGNYCRGGAYISSLLGCESIAILPEEMSRERFEWLSNIAGEVIPTPGCESNVKEIFDKCKELKKTRENIVVFNQFDQFGNYLWHYEVTGNAFDELFNSISINNNRLAGIVLSSGSAGTLGAGDFLKQKFPNIKIAAGEALQCPTLLLNGFGGHKIEGIGDKHVPWIHNVRNTDVIIAVDDDCCMNLMRLFNEPAGNEFLLKSGIPENTVKNLNLLGISGTANLICSIKFAKYFELTKNDIIFTVFTDSMELYRSRLDELNEEFGEYTENDAAIDFNRYIKSVSIDNLLELRFQDKKRIHNLKYFTWVEQQGKKVEELNAQWYDYPDYWKKIQKQTGKIDKLIKEFNEKTGLLKK